MTTRTELNTLEASGLVQVATLEPELEYLFRHALVQDAAYSSLLKQDRRALHRLAADTLLSLYPERRRELAGVIALHLERAGDTAAAAEYLVIAGEHALERFANKDGTAFFDRADASFAPDDARSDLRLRSALGAAKVGWPFYGPDASIERLERTVTAVEGTADRALLADAYFWIAFLRRLRGEGPATSSALRHAVDRAAEIGTALGDPSAHAVPNAFMAVGMIFTGELREGARILEESIEGIGEHIDPVSASILNGLLTIAYARLGEFAAADHSLERARHFAQNGDPISTLDAEIAWSAVLVERGDIDQGETIATSCALQSEELGAISCAVSSNVIAGAAHLARDDAFGAKAPLERGEALAQVSSMAAFQTLAEGMLGSVRLRLGDVAGGTAGWAVALERAGAMKDRYGEATTLWQRARARAAATPPDHAAAFADIDAASRLFDEMGARPALARSLRDRARVLRGLGRDAEAAKDEARSRAIGAELGLKDFA